MSGDASLLDTAPTPGNELRGGVWSYATLAAVAFATAAWTRAGTAWDGSYYLVTILGSQQPIHFYDRYSTVPLQWPALLLSRVTDDTKLIGVVFSAAFGVVPILALLLSWLVIRRRAGHMAVWPALGVGLVCLSGLMFLVSESMMVAELTWPLLLITLIALEGPWLAVGAVLALALFWLAAPAVGSFALIAVVAFVRGVLQPRIRRRAWTWAGVFACAIPIHILVRRADFQGHPLSLQLVKANFKLGVWGRPAVVVFLATLAGAAIIFPRIWKLADRTQRLLHLLAPAAALGAGVVAVTWASDPAAWTSTLYFRDFALILQIPLFVMAAADALDWPRFYKGAASSARVRSRWTIVVAAGLGLCATVTVQSVAWASEVKRMDRVLAQESATCVSPRLVASRRSALNGWWAGSLVLLEQGKRPRHVLLDGADCELLRNEGILRLNEFTVWGRGGWFQLPG